MLTAPRHLVETKVKSVRVYKGNSVSFYRDIVRLPSGRQAVRDYMRHPGAVSIVPFVDRKRVLILRQYRYPVHRAIWEFPAGKLDAEESPSRCARRELVEETGYYPRRIKKINSFWPTPAFATEIMDIFLAWDLQRRETSLDEDESLDVHVVEFSKVLEWVRRGRVRDAKSVIAALAIQAFGLFPPQ